LSAYQFWIDSLAGKRPAIVNEHPEAGFYRMKRKDRWVPVAVWPVNGVLKFKFGTEVVGSQMGVECWPSYASNAITEEIWRDVVEHGKDWPDADPTVAAILSRTGAQAQREARGTPLPAFEQHGEVHQIPGADPADELKEAITMALKGVEGYAKIEGEDANAKAAGLRNMLLKLSNDADREGKALYEPPFREYKKHYDKYNPLVKLAADGAQRVRKAMEVYQDDLRKAAAQAVARAAEENRKRQQAIDDAAVQAQIDGQPSPEPVKVEPVAPVSNMAAPATQVKPTYGKAAAVQTRMEVTGIDADKMLAALKARAEWGLLEAFLLELAQKLANKGIILSGVTAEEKAKIK
jgi:hypothetical protein